MIKTEITVYNENTSRNNIFAHYGPEGIKDCSIQHIIKERERETGQKYIYVSHITKEINRGGPGRGQGRKRKPPEEHKARLTFTLSRSIATWLELMAKQGHVKSRVVEKALWEARGGDHG